MNVAAVVPLNALERAKSRLAGTVGPARAELVGWMLERVLRACRSAPITRVLVVAGDDRAAALAARAGVEVVVERRRGMAAALVRADRMTATADASLVVPADLPLVRAADLDAVVRAGRRRAVVVAVADDGGTGALWRRPPDVIRPAFGPGSADAHVTAAEAAGVDVAIVRIEGLATDVDTPSQLRQAAAREPALAGWLHARRLRLDDIRDAQEPPMPQGTVKYFDIETNTGTILLDDQEELPLDAETFAASGLVELRLGQRVRFDIEEDDGGRRIRRLTLVSL